MAAGGKVVLGTAAGGAISAGIAYYHWAAARSALNPNHLDGKK